LIMTFVRKVLNRRAFIWKSSLGLVGMLIATFLRPLRISGSDTQKKSKRIVVIGSGVTGLCSAAILSKQGFTVTVLEANKKYLGGHARTYHLGGLSFCTGPQYVWNFGEGEIGKQVLKYLNLDNKVTFNKMNENGFETFLIGDAKPVLIPMGLRGFEKTTIEHYPNMTNEITKFFSIIIELYQSASIMERKGLYLLNRSKTIRRIIFDQEMNFHQKRTLIKFKDYSLVELFTYCGLSGEVTRFLYGHSGIFAENISEVSAVIYASATGSYHSGAFIPEKGFETLIEVLSEFILAHNGSIIHGKTVTEIENSGQYASAVICSDKSKYISDILISNLSPRLTCQLLYGCESGKYHYKPSNTLVSCFIVLKDSEEINQALKLKNYWWQDDKHEVNFNDPDMNELPRMLYIGSPSANSLRDYSNQRNSSLVIFAPGNFEQAKQIRAQSEESYELLKNTISDNILHVLDKKIFPGIRANILHVKIETPWDIFLMTGAEYGNVYGRRMTAQSILANDLGPLDKIQNLHIGCASVGLPGVATCFRTASIICERISGLKID
jgi:all-trans-retinol 13,14-reductase